MRRHSLLFQLSCRFIKYFFLFTFGLATAGILGSLFEAASIVLLMFHSIKLWWLRFALGSLLTLGFAAVFESVQ